jgi:hypothetical protein
MSASFLCAVLKEKVLVKKGECLREDQLFGLSSLHRHPNLSACFNDDVGDVCVNDLVFPASSATKCDSEWANYEDGLASYEKAIFATSWAVRLVILALIHDIVSEVT